MTKSTPMDSPIRPVTGTDTVTRPVLIQPGFVFAGHLDVSRLQDSAAKVLDVYPELKVSVKGDWFTLGEWHTLPATGHAWDFEHRDLPDKTLADVFGPAAAATELDLSSSPRVTSLGATQVVESQSLFGFDGPPLGSLGWSPLPILSFRVTTLGTPDIGHTLLSMVVPHVITDAMGVGGLVETWGRLYNGEDVPTRTGNPHPDLLQTLEAVPTGDSMTPIKESEQPGRGLSTGFLSVLSYVRNLWRLTSKGTEERYIHFPGRLLEKYRDEARARLGPDTHGPIVSTHDVFCAMMLKLYAHSSLVSDDAQPLDFYNVYSMAPAFPKGSLPSPYLHNINVVGWFPFPSSSGISSMPLPDLADMIRRRLNVLRTVENVRETIMHHERTAFAILRVPLVDGRHGWGMVSSWGGVEDMVKAGFAGEKLVFLRPATQNPGDAVVPNIAFSFRDGHGGIIARTMLVKGDWDAMLAGSGLGDL